MKDLNNWIEQIHAENRKLRDAEQGTAVGSSRQSAWPWAAAGAAVAVAAVLCLMVVDRQQPIPHEVLAVATPVAIEQPEPEPIAEVHPAKVPTKEARNAASGTGDTVSHSPEFLPKPTVAQAEEEYAYSMTESGIKVYCENQCNADEVLALMEDIVKQSVLTI